MNCSCSKQIFFEILCLHVPVYRRSGDKGIKHFPDSSGGSRGRAQGPPLYFWTKMRPKGLRTIFEDLPNPPIPPPYLEVWICHQIVSATYDCITLQLSLLASYIFTDCTLIIKYISIVVILTGFDSEKYSLLGCNLKNRAALENCLLKCGLNTTVPTLLLSEVVLTYIDPPQRYVLFKH